MFLFRVPIVRTVVLFVVALSLAPVVCATDIQIVPASPRSQELVVARLTLGRPSVFFVTGASVTQMKNNVVQILYTASVELPSSGSYDISLGQFPPGDYAVEVRRAGAQEVEASAGFTVLPVGADGFKGPSVNYSGQWWSPAEPGWGIAITQGPGYEVFAEWFMYDDLGMPVWLTIEQGTWTSQREYSGRLMRYTNGPRVASGGGPPVAVDLGPGVLSFGSAYSGSISFDLGGVRVGKPITRLPIP